MKVTKLDDVDSVKYEAKKSTETEIKNEHDYLVAESLTKKLLEKGLITQTEYKKIMAKNRITFSLRIPMKTSTYSEFSRTLIPI